MTERGLPSADASPACPFVAFEDDRDERADRPDHRHRCYAEAEPAPRAIAHQEAYCLSSAFPVCPVFQEWARREAARARSGDPTPAAAPPAPPPIAPPPGDPGAPRSSDDPARADEWAPGRRPPEPEPPGLPPRRNPPRDWAAPPPWAGGGAGPGRGAGSDPAGPRVGRGSGDAVEPPDFLTRRGAEGQGLAGSAADRLAQGDAPSTPAARPASGPSAIDRSTGPDPDLAGLVHRPVDDEPDGPVVRSRAAGLAGGRSGDDRPDDRLDDRYDRDDDRDDPDSRLARERAAERDAEAESFARSVGSFPAGRAGKRPTVSSTRGKDAERRERERANGEAPSWERARRYEAYPTIKTRAGMPGLPRVAVLAGALALAAIAVFFLPALLGVGGDDDPGATASPSASVGAPTPTPEPTPTPAPTAQTYVIKEGDTLSGIARDFGLTLEELLAANTETIEDPDRISVGDEIIIPVPPPDEVDGGGASASPAP